MVACTPAHPVIDERRPRRHQDRFSGGQYVRPGPRPARGLVTKHAIKQVDRLLSDEGIDIYTAWRDGVLPWWDPARASMWPWIGPISTPMAGKG